MGQQSETELQEAQLMFFSPPIIDFWGNRKRVRHFSESVSQRKAINRSRSNMAEILLDPNIRFWVFLPIVLITLLVGVIRHYVSLLLASDKTVDEQQLQNR